MGGEPRIRIGAAIIIRARFDVLTGFILSIPSVSVDTLSIVKIGAASYCAVLLR